MLQFAFQHQLYFKYQLELILTPRTGMNYDFLPDWFLDSNLHVKPKPCCRHLFKDLNHIMQFVMLLYLDGINFRLQDSNLMRPEFALINNKNLHTVSFCLIKMKVK